MNEEFSDLPAANKKSGLILKILAGAVILLLLTGILFTRLIFAPWEEIQPLYPDPQDFSVQYKLMRKVSKSFSDRKRLAQKATLAMAPAELNSLFRMAANITPSGTPLPFRYYRPSVSQDGVFSLTIPCRSSASWLWGGTVYIRAAFTLSKEKGKDLQIGLKSLKITDLSLPLSTAQGAVEKMMRKKEIMRNLSRFNDSIETLRFDRGKFLIEYIPAKLMLRNF